MFFCSLHKTKIFDILATLRVTHLFTSWEFLADLLQTVQCGPHLGVKLRVGGGWRCLSGGPDTPDTSPPPSCPSLSCRSDPGRERYNCQLLWYIYSWHKHHTLFPQVKIATPWNVVSTYFVWRRIINKFLHFKDLRTPNKIRTKAKAI